MPLLVKRKIPSTPVKPDFRVKAFVVSALEFPACARAPIAEIASNASPASGCGFLDIRQNSDLKKFRIFQFLVPQTNLLAGLGG